MLDVEARRSKRRFNPRSNDAAPRSEMPCVANDGGEWRRYISDFGPIFLDLAERQ